MQLLINEQSQRKGFPQEEKGGKRILKQHHRRLNLEWTVYRENIKPRAWKRKNYCGFWCHITYCKLGRKHDDPQGGWTRVTVGDSRTLTSTSCGDWQSYQIRDGKLYRVTLSNMYIIPILQEKKFRMARVLLKGFQLKSKGETLILKKNQPRFVLTRKCRKNMAKDFYWPLGSTRAQNTPLFCSPRSGIRKVIQPCIWKGRLSRNKRIQQPKQLRRVKFMPTRSTRSLSILDKTGYARPQSTYNK